MSVCPSTPRTQRQCQTFIVEIRELGSHNHDKDRIEFDRCWAVGSILTINRHNYSTQFVTATDGPLPLLSPHYEAATCMLSPKMPAVACGILFQKLSVGVYLPSVSRSRAYVWSSGFGGEAAWAARGYFEVLTGVRIPNCSF